MKYIGRSLKFNRIVYRKYTKKYKFNIKILTFLKSNYKYKRRCLRKTLTKKMSAQRNSLHRRQIRNNNEIQKEKHQLPVEEDMLKNNKNIIQRIPIYDNTKFDKFLKIFILIMQQAQLTATTINDITSVNASNGLEARPVAKTKAIKNTNSSASTSNVNEDEINRNHRAYKDANKDTDNNIDIGSNIVDEISHQQHNYDKVSTITSTPIKCQRRKHLQVDATKTYAKTLSPSSSSSPSAPLTSPTTMTTSLSSPSVVVQTNYETYQWSAILRNCACDSPPIHHQYHHYHHKRKHIQHHHLYQQQHQQQQHQWQQHAVHIKSLTSRSLLSDNNNSNNNKSDSSSIKNNNRSHNSNTIDSPTCSAIAVYQTLDQYVNATWNRSYSISCLLLTLFIAFTIGIRSTTAGACWQTVLDNGKCNEIFSLNISKSECCGANQEFAYTEREPTNVEYFFATAIGGGMECSPCLESCRNVKCGPNKKCVKRKGRPKCICAPECGAARRRRKQREHSMQPEQRSHQHHTEDLFTSISKDVGDVDDEDDDISSAAVVQPSNGFNIKIDKSQQSRDIRSLSSEITNVNLGLKDGKHVMMINSGGATSQIERHHSNNKEHNQNQRKLIHVHLEEHPYSQQQQETQQKSKKSNDLQQYTHQMQQRQQEDRLRLQLEQQQMKRKDQEPKGSRRLLITANVEHTEKPTTRRLQIFSNVRTTHARRRNSNKKKSNTSNSNSNRNNNKKKNKKDQHEDTDPSDTDIDDKVVENDEDYNYNDTEDNEGNIETKMKFRSSNSNGNSNNNNKNNINRNDDATRFLNQSLSRHKLTTNIRVNNKNSNISHSKSKSSDNNKNSTSNERKIKRKKNHDLHRTEILQHHSSDNNTRFRYPQQNQSHAVDISHHRHNRHHHHRQQQQRKHNHHRQDFHNHNHHKKHHHQQQNHHRRHHGRQKFNTHQQQQQTIGTKEPKNDKDYNATITVVSPIPTTITPATYNTLDTTKTAPSFTTVLQSQLLNSALATPLMNLSSSSSSLSSSSALENSTSVIIVTTTSNQQIQPSRSQLLLSSSASMPSLSAATPVNSTLSALNSGAAAVVAADDFYHSHSQNHGSKIATSSSLSTSSTSSSYSQPSASVSASSESAFLPSVSAKGEGVSSHDHQHRRIQILASNKHNNNNNDNDNDDHKIAALNSNLHNNPQQQEEQKEQQHDQQQPQAHQQYFHSTLFDAISDQIDFMGFSTKQQTITDAEFDRPLNPVCGTDGRTYNTECQLRKRACRTDNPNLQIAYRGHCRTTCNGVKCLNGLTCIEDQFSMPHCITCKIECPQDDCDNDVVDATKAVCGADGKTYKSVCDINRMICKIGRSIGVAYPGPCRVEQITCDDINCGPKQVCLIDWLTQTPRCTSCRYKCSRKRRPSFPPFEEGKICGVNNRTYNSWCEMRKDSCSTGFYIDLKYAGDCH